MGGRGGLRFGAGKRLLHRLQELGGVGHGGMASFGHEEVVESEKASYVGAVVRVTYGVMLAPDQAGRGREPVEEDPRHRNPVPAAVARQVVQLDRLRPEWVGGQLVMTSDRKHQSGSLYASGMGRLHVVKYITQRACGCVKVRTPCEMVHTDGEVAAHEPVGAGRR